MIVWDNLGLLVLRLHESFGLIVLVCTFLQLRDCSLLLRHSRQKLLDLVGHLFHVVVRLVLSQRDLVHGLSDVAHACLGLIRVGLNLCHVRLEALLVLEELLEKDSDSRVGHGCDGDDRC